jgi:hypothetical protein
MAPRILNLGTRRIREVNCTPRPIYSRGKSPVAMESEAGCSQCRFLTGRYAFPNLARNTNLGPSSLYPNCYTDWAICVSNPWKDQNEPGLYINIQLVPRNKHVRLSYTRKNQSVNAGEGNNRCLFWDPNKTQTHCGQNVELLNGTYNNHWPYEG